MRRKGSRSGREYHDSECDVDARCATCCLLEQRYRQVFSEMAAAPQRAQTWTSQCDNDPLTRCSERHKGRTCGRLARRVVRPAACGVLRCTPHNTQAHYYSPDTRKILRPSATNKNDLVLLEVVSFSRNVGDGRLSGGELDTAHLTHGRVGLTRLGRVDLGHDTLLLRAALEQRRLGLLRLVLAVSADDCGLAMRRRP